MQARLRQALARAEEVARALADPETARDSGKLTALGREHARLEPISRAAERLGRLEVELAQARELAQEARGFYRLGQREKLERIAGVA